MIALAMDIGLAAFVLAVAAIPVSIILALVIDLFRD